MDAGFLLGECSGLLTRETKVEGHPVAVLGDVVHRYVLVAPFTLHCFHLCLLCCQSETVGRIVPVDIVIPERVRLGTGVACRRCWAR